MTPTNKLRLVERVVSKNRPDLGEGIAEQVKCHILQQWWEGDHETTLYPHGVWRDVPVEKEL